MPSKYNATLRLEHFSEFAFRRDLCLVFDHLARQDTTYPLNHERAKEWEVTQAARGLRDFGALTPDSEILGVAAGYEHTVYYLTNVVKRVFATDLYVTNELWREADHKMLSNPGALAPPDMKWNPRRLVAQHMDALALNYEDESFDGVFSSGSIEHFGSLKDVVQAAQEMGRVLRPGGVLALSTEFRIAGDPNEVGLPGTILFTPEMLMRYIVEPSGLHLVDEPDFSVSEATAAEAYPIQEAIEHGPRPRSIALTSGDWKWTSVSLCLQKR
jgi:SAM-dependent methyltransferase